MQLLRLFIDVLARLRAELALSIGLAVLAAALASVGVLEAVLFGRVVNALVAGENALAPIAVWGGVSLVGIVAGVVLALLADRLAHRRRLATLADALHHALQRPPREFSMQGSGELIRNILVGSDAFFWLWLSAFREITPALAAVLVLFPIAIIISPLMALALCVLMVVYIVANAAIVHRTQASQAAVDSHHRSLSNRINDVVTNAGVVHAFTRLHQEIESLRAMTAALLQMQYPVLNWWALLSVFTRASATVSLVLVFLVGSWLVGRGQLSIGEVVTFAGFAGLLISRLDQAAAAVGRIFPVAGVIDGLLTLLAEDKRQTEDAKKPDLPITEGRVEFCDVNYTFPGTRIGLRGIDLSAAPGQITAIVGPTGSGKSTLVSLLQRIFEPDGGEIRIDGHPISGFNAPSVRRAIANVAQEAGLFSRSIADNLRIARPNATDEDLLEALRRAQLLGLVESKPEGLNFQIGERGARLSGGERQRLSIARAILKDAPILILDEATSALDTRTEELVQQAILEASAGRTTFIVAHRLATIRNADQILVLDHGVIVERGHYDELSALDGVFASMVRADAKAPRPELEAELDKLRRH